ncbi:DUF6804 family protein [Sinomonas gamaensis]|uniref:DUF6804 family protein n=1 Tax=Sinomonas gamaensis TaxID=2565624 RepID=UPI001108C53A|nr:DUF6804 family protein [Sinomonas gamaensis]
MSMLEAGPEEYKPAALPGWVAGIMSLLGVLSFQYWYYDLLRWIVTIAAIWVCTIAFRLQKPGWGIAFIIVAIVFNPIIPFTANKQAWAVPDVITGVLFIRAALTFWERKGPNASG